MQAINLSDLPPDARIENERSIEERWAETAAKYAEIIEKLLVSAGRKSIDHLHRMRFTPMDNEIYKIFRTAFPELDVKRVDVASLKSAEAKAKWYMILESWKDSLKDYNIGTLLRIDCAVPLSPENSCIVPRSQFYCIEIARCREGLNDEFVQSVIDGKQTTAKLDPDA